MGFGGDIYPRACLHAGSVGISSRPIFTEHSGREHLDVPFLLVSSNDSLDGIAERDAFFGADRHCGTAFPRGLSKTAEGTSRFFNLALNSDCIYVRLGVEFVQSCDSAVAPNKPAPPTPQPPKDACGNPLVFQNGGYEPTSCPFNPNEPPATPKQRVCQFVAGVSVPLAFVGVPEVASYLEIGPAAARFLAWTGVGGTLIGLPCS